MVKGFGRRPLARAGRGTMRPALESLPRRKPRSGKGAGAARTFYGDLRIAGCRRRGLEAKVDRALPDSGIEWPGDGRCRRQFWPVVGADLGIGCRARTKWVHAGERSAARKSGFVAR